MKYILILLIIPFMAVSECGQQKKETTATTENKKPAKDSIPPCVRRIIDEGKKETPSTAPQQIDEYLYNGKKVFLFTAQCCDQFNMLYDDSCKVICSPSGGFVGKGDGKCPDFSKAAQHIKMIWKDTTQ